MAILKSRKPSLCFLLLCFSASHRFRHTLLCDSQTFVPQSHLGGFVGEESTGERGGGVVLNLLYKLPQYKGEAVQQCLICNCPLLRCLRCNSSGWSCQSLMDTQQQSHGRRWFIFPCLPFEPCTVWTTCIKIYTPSHLWPPSYLYSDSVARLRVITASLYVYSPINATVILLQRP